LQNLFISRSLTCRLVIVFAGRQFCGLRTFDTGVEGTEYGALL
jgi:hypothetical protein